MLEAQYADAVRLGIDQLGMAFVDVIEARETLRYKQANVDRLGQMVDVTRQLLRQSTQARPDLDRMAILHDTAEIELDAARSNHTQALRSLAVLLQFPEPEPTPWPSAADPRCRPPPPSVNELVALAVCNRPDVVAYRRGVRRAMADVQLAAASDSRCLLVLHPYAFHERCVPGAQSATSWSVGGLVSIPLFNRNQGNIHGPGRGWYRRRSNSRAWSGRPRPRCGEPPSTLRRRARPSDDSRATSSAAPAATRRPLPPLHRGRTDHLRLLQCRARLQRGRPPVLRQLDPPPPQHAPAQHGRGPAHPALMVSHPARADGFIRMIPFRPLFA